jgi:hypothetical protein
MVNEQTHNIRRIQRNPESWSLDTFDDNHLDDSVANETFASLNEALAWVLLEA